MDVSCVFVVLLFWRPKVVFLAQFGHVGWGVLGVGVQRMGVVLDLLQRLGGRCLWTLNHWASGALMILHLLACMWMLVVVDVVPVVGVASMVRARRSTALKEMWWNSSGRYSWGCSSKVISTPLLVCVGMGLPVPVGTLIRFLTWML